MWRKNSDVLMVEYCKLTLEDCENILNALHMANSCIMISSIHGYNPFNELSDEDTFKHRVAFDKIKTFVEENSHGK